MLKPDLSNNNIGKGSMRVSIYKRIRLKEVYYQRPVTVYKLMSSDLRDHKLEVFQYSGCPARELTYLYGESSRGCCSCR